MIYDSETLAILEVNDAAIAHYGYSRDEFLSMTIKNLRPSSEIPLLLNSIAARKENSQQSFSGISKHITKNCEEIIVEVSGHLFTFENKECMIVECIDITNRERALAQLKDNAAKLKTASMIAKVGYWQFQRGGGNRYWSDEVFEIWNQPKGIFESTYVNLVEGIHPEDRPLFENHQKEYLISDQELTVEYRIVLADGSFKWILEIGKLALNDESSSNLIQGTVQDITAQKVLALALEESNLRYNYVTKATSNAIWDWDITNNTLYWGEGSHELFGYDVGANETTIESWTDHLHPDDKYMVTDSINQMINGTETNWVEEYRYLKSDQTYAYVVDRGFVIRNKEGLAVRMVGAMHDITRRKLQEHHLKLLESAINNTTDAVMITESLPLDAPGPIIIYVNEAFTRMTGFTASEIIGKNPRMFQGSKSDNVSLKKLGNAIRHSESCEITVINYKNDGSEFYNNFSVNPVKDESGVVTHFVSIQRDITGKIMEEKQLKKFADDLYKQNKELQQFGYVVSHNLRSPVANIMGIASLLEMDYEDLEMVQKCTTDLKLSVNRLDQVIRDLSEILSITDGSVELTKENVDLTQVIIAVKGSLEDVITKTGCDIQTPVGSYFIYSHNAYLYSIFYNLISNAIKYRSDEKSEIIIEVKRNENFLVITVSDNGIGIDLQKNINEIFKPYKRFNSNTEGKGLGLFLVKSHVEALKGKIYVESELGKGATFTITLPSKGIS